MNSFAALGLSLLVVSVCACRQRDVRTVTLRCPQVQSPAAVERVVRALELTDGVMSGRVTVAHGAVTVPYDSMKVALKNLEFVIAGTGFDANDTPADGKARAALPAEAR